LLNLQSYHRAPLVVLAENAHPFEVRPVL